MTAQRTLDLLELKSGQTLLIHNGSGGAGRAAIQLAVDRGVRVIATASERRHPRLRELGAEPVEYGPGLVSRVRAVAPGGVDAVADFVGGVLADTLAVLRDGGRHASVADPAVLEHGGSFVWVRPDGRELERLTALAEAGKLTVDIERTYPLEQTAEAFRASMEGHTGGKIVLTPFSQ
jgi:NADPH:quinone reductase-like Zn-dependent oxidoreductase